MFDHLAKRIVPLLLTFTVSVFLASAFQTFLRPELAQDSQTERRLEGSGSAYSGPGLGVGVAKPEPKAPRGVTAPLLVTFQPKAAYTDEARENNVQGSVRLKITLLASGRVGSIIPVTELPYGLTERAIAAARQIRFEPKTVNGVPVSVVITREYTFTIY